MKHNVTDDAYFDTIRVTLPSEGVADGIIQGLEAQGINIRRLSPKDVTISLDESVNENDVKNLWKTFHEFSSEKGKKLDFTPTSVEKEASSKSVLSSFKRTSKYLEHPIFNAYHSEHEMLRYIHRLQKKDLGLTTSNIPLGSCTVSAIIQ
jgi:glycine dehydrogenase